MGGAITAQDEVVEDGLAGRLVVRRGLRFPASKYWNADGTGGDREPQPNLRSKNT